MKSCNDQYAPYKAIFPSAFAPVQVRNTHSTPDMEDVAACNVTNTQ
jgi:hypothetical protein